MNPILLGKQVVEGLEDLVRSSFETTSPAYAGMIDTFLETEGNFIKGPWLSVDLPFRPASLADEPFPQVPLGFRPHRHQELAFNRLRAPNARSTLVATGTGSGKTECYLWPILDACRARQHEPGVKAIIIYPMNALAGDQARRIAKAITSIPELAGVRCGIYADAEPKPSTDKVSATDVITSREEMRRNPPDILLTNYKMLDYLLLRGSDKRLWAQNAPETLRYLVVDELHTFDGAQGADLALLIRRLKARLKTPENHLACVGSSATLGSGEEAVQRLIDYAQDLFGERFEANGVIREDRLKTHEYLESIDYTDLPAPARIAEAIEAGLTQSQAEVAGHLARLFFEDFDPASAYFDKTVTDDPADPAWRVALGKRLRAHVAFHRVLEAIQESGKAASLADAVEALSGARLFRAGWEREELAALVEAVVILTSWARRDLGGRVQPLLNVRLQIWAREMGRMTARVPHFDEAGAQQPAVLHHSDDLEPLQLAKTLPVVLCRHCGTSGQVCRVPEAGSSFWAPLETLYNEFFDGGDRIRFVYFDEVFRQGKSAGYGGVAKVAIDPGAMTYKPSEHDAQDGASIPAWFFNPVNDRGYVDRTCPSCGTAHSLQILGLRSARLSAALSTTLFNSDHHEESDTSKPRVLIFSDSVQDAAQRAAVTEIRNTQTVIRKALYSGVTSHEDGPVSLEALIGPSIEALRAQLGEVDFVARFTARDQTWREPYQALSLNDEPPADRMFGDDVAVRLGWEFFSELTYRSRTSQTLETARLCVAEAEPRKLVEAAEDFRAALHAELGADYAMDEADACAFIIGLATHMRRAGAVAHPYVRAAIERGVARKGPRYFAAQQVLGLGRRGVLPTPDQRTSAAPRCPTLRSLAEGFQFVGRDAASNWYRAWVNRFFGRASGGLGTHHTDIYTAAFQCLARQGLAEPIMTSSSDAVEVWTLKPSAIQVSKEVETLSCNRCGRRELVLRSSAHLHQACLRIGCEGDLLANDEEGAGSAVPSAYLEGVMGTSRNHRVVAREHTGILETDDRRRLETLFINGEAPWHPNLISATPTLEMGIDIGDLSSLILASMPPEEANYVQRIGRTGRRDGNSLNVTLISARPHDLQFWEEPGSMLAGQVTPPGVHLQAIAVLRRQAAAFALDRFVAQSETEIDYSDVNSALSALDRNLSSQFPCNWFAHLEGQGGDIADAFMSILPESVRARDGLIQQLRAWLTSAGEDGLRFRIIETFDAVRQERAELLELQKRLDGERRKLREQAPPPTDLDDQLQRLKERRTEVSRAIRETINQVKILQFLTDRGLLPNYAFPEEGVKLKSIIVKSREAPASGAGSDADLIIREYQRPGSSALSEFAPDQTFYAEGRQVTIDRIDLRSRDIATWRFCPNCTHSAIEATSAPSSVCPKCNTPMWADTGAQCEAVELRSVVATSSEQKAAIRDLDDRTSRQYDREVFPSYAADGIEVAYAIKDGKGSAPFGFEFIPQCEFRDINFGQKTGARIGRMVAGEQRPSRPFQICRRCGMLQTDQNDAERDQKPGTHQSRCSADNMGEPRAQWEAPVYLMRRFTTESLRLIVPVAGRAQDDDIKSFVAAIELGLKRHFSGRVDHIRSAVVEERLSNGASVKNLYLYDAIPGGSGYLRQLAASPQTLLRVLRLSAAALRDCACASDPDKNGCFRCVKSYRTQFGPGEPRRDLALQLIEAVLSDWDALVQVDRAINDVLGADLIESELEARFLDALSREFGRHALKQTVLSSGKRGFQLRIDTDGEDLFWQIEPQVQVKERFPGLPERRVDFVISSTGDRADKPIVVELDGWEYHAETIEKDVEDRMNMIRSGRVEVWTLTWDDFHVEPVNLANPFRSAKGDAVLAQLTSAEQFSGLHKHGPDLDRLRHGRSIDALIARLKPGYFEPHKAAILFSRVAIGPKGETLESLAGYEALSEDASLFLKEAALHGAVGDQGLTAYLGLPECQPLDIVDQSGAARILLRADLALHGVDRKLDEASRVAWMGLWRSLNLLQGLGGLHVVLPGMDTLDAPTAAGGDASDMHVEMVWQEVLSFVDEEIGRTLRDLQQAQIPVPDMLGEDLMSGDRVAGTVEVGWRAGSLAVALDPFELEGWTIEPAVAPESNDYPDFLRRIIRHLTGGAT